MKTIAKYDLQRQPSPHNHIEPIEPLETTQVQWDNVSLLLTAWRDVTVPDVTCKGQQQPQKKSDVELDKAKEWGNHLKLAQRS